MIEHLLNIHNYKKVINVNFRFFQNIIVVNILICLTDCQKPFLKTYF